MKTTDFAVYLNRYFTKYMPNDKGSSPQTIDTYRYAFILFLEYMNEERKINADKLRLLDFTRESVVGYLGWLEKKRKCSISSRNIRLAAMKGFVHYLKYEYPDYLEEYQKILGIPLKKAPTKEISYMKTDGVELLVNQVDLNDSNGLRDYVMILILYTTGIRVSELINIKVKDLSLSVPYTILVHGKGNKSRYVPLMKTAVPHIKKYLESLKLDNASKYEEVLFKNHMKKNFTRQGVNYILKKYGAKARELNPELVPQDLSAHKIRHTTAMELVSSGVELIYIRDLLGHSSVLTTEHYARTDAQIKRKAIEAASKEIVPPEEAIWESDNNLINWLKSFNKR